MEGHDRGRVSRHSWTQGWMRWRSKIVGGKVGRGGGFRRSRISSRGGNFDATAVVNLGSKELVFGDSRGRQGSVLKGWRHRPGEALPRRFSAPLSKSKHGAGRDALAMDSKARPGTMAQETLGDGGRRLRSRRRTHTRSARWRSQMSDFGGAGIEFGNCGGGGDDGSGDGQR
ncbi:uncharacterized protein M6B38_147945 [Iris pallida]|uniref:Uncharacterized protein n=1 Tax=Iris pallida TaxID=29817 RepID=A0AAX6F8J1_IRIPA|nr:uncharacterized protein M6B38_147945 [Iris pallida]